MNRTYAVTAVVPHVNGGKPLAAWFILTAGVILAITGGAKIWSALGTSKFLAAVDPILGLKFGQLLLAVGLAEIAVALVCCFSRRQTLALGLIAWLATNFLVYRVGLWWMDWKRPCGCLGNLTDALHLSPQAAENIMKVLLAYLLIGSYGLVVWRWRQRRNSLAAEMSRLGSSLAGS
jgi:hypothetical protein